MVNFGGLTMFDIPNDYLVKKIFVVIFFKDSFIHHILFFLIKLKFFHLNKILMTLCKDLMSKFQVNTCLWL